LDHRFRVNKRQEANGRGTYQGNSFYVAAEYEAIQMYMQLADSTDNKLAVEVLKDIADEERVHAGEFLRLLHELAPDEKKFYAKGEKEVEGEIKKMK